MGSAIINFQPFGNRWLFGSKMWSERGAIKMWRELLFLRCSSDLIQWQSSVTGKIHRGTDFFPGLKLSAHFHCCLQKETCNAVRCSLSWEFLKRDGSACIKKTNIYTRTFLSWNINAGILLVTTLILRFYMRAINWRGCNAPFPLTILIIIYEF